MTRKSNSTPTIGSIATQLLKAGFDAESTLTRVKMVFPEAKTTLKCIYYYASQAKVQLRKSAVVDSDELAKLMKELKSA